MMKNRHIGSSFDEFLEEEDLYTQVEVIAVKRVLAHQLKKLMKKFDLSKKDMAHRMHTSRSSLDRLLDPENTSVTLDTLARAAMAVGKRLDIHLVSGKHV